MHWIDPNQLPATTGTFSQFLLNMHGEVDGMMFVDGTEIHFPRHMSEEICAAVEKDPAMHLTVRGVRPRLRSDVIAAIAFDLPDGHRILDNGPPHASERPEHKEHAKRKPMQLEGRVVRPLHDPKGEVRGMLLDNGCIVRLAPHGANHCEKFISAGKTVAIRGEGLTVPHGTAIEAREIGDDLDHLVPTKHK
jgi:hypothetical protein